MTARQADIRLLRIPAADIKPGDYLDVTRKVRVHTVRTSDPVPNGRSLTTLAWRLRGSKAPGVTLRPADKIIPVWRRVATWKVTATS
jgi:hypothetical protein